MLDKQNSHHHGIMLTREEMEAIARERISEVSAELENGFAFLADHPRSVTFFGSRMTEEDSHYYKDARHLAGRIAKELHYAVVTGGGPGIMEAANRGAYEAHGESLGLNIRLTHGQRTNGFNTKNMSFYYFFVRKVCLSFSAEAFIFYPGGYGTLDEFYEIITLVQTKKIENVPIICVGKEYWDKLKDLMSEHLLSRGTIDHSDLDLFTITDNHDEIIDIIRNVPIRGGVPISREKRYAARPQAL